MPPSKGQGSPQHAEWLELCRRASEGVDRALAGYAGTAERARVTGRGEGGDMTLAIDRAAEDAILAELEAVGSPLTAISEERGEVALSGGGPVRVVIDPIDGSLNAKRALPFFSLSIAVGAATMADVHFGYVRDLARGDEWWAASGEGAFRDGQPLECRPAGHAGAPLEILGIETAHPHLVAEAAPRLVRTGAARLRAIGSVALSLCLVGAGQLDAMVSLREVRSVDAAAGQLIVREAGGVAEFPDAGREPLGASLDLAMRSRVLAARSPALLQRLRDAI